jgi:predicted AAA+ superfamily ATPase
MCWDAIELLEKLYLVFLLPPFSSSLSRSIRKDRRVYFFDCAAAYDATGGAQLENLVACSLLKFTQFRATAGEVRNQAPIARQMARCVAVRPKAGEVAESAQQRSCSSRIRE